MAIRAGRGRMAWPVRQPRAWRGSLAGPSRLSPLVFILLLLYLALMTTEHHDARGEALHGALAMPGVAIAALAPLPQGAHDDHDAPRNTLDGCPVGVAALPLLLALFAIAALALVGHTEVVPANTGARRTRRATRPPPLAAPQRRALLQVFLI